MSVESAVPLNLERRGFRGGTVLVRCTSGCLGNTVYYGSVYSYWKTGSFNCSADVLGSAPYTGGSRSCYLVTETCVDSTGCVNSDNCSSHCCRCGGGDISAGLALCATENSICTLSGSGSWIYFGALSINTVVSSACETSALSDPLQSQSAVQKFCFVADTLNTRRWVTVGELSEVTDWRAIDSSGCPRMSYDYRLVDPAGVLEPSDPKVIAFSPPLQPSIVSIVPGTVSGRLTVSWTPLIDSASSLPVAYRVYVDGRRMVETHLLVWSFVDCVPGMRYDFTVVGVSNDQEGRPSNVLSRLCGDVPGLMLKPRLAQSTSTSITISWTPPVYAGHAPVTGYRILRSVVPDLNMFASLASVTPDVTDLTDIVTCGRVYRYRIYPTNGIDDADASNVSPFLPVLCKQN